MSTHAWPATGHTGGDVVRHDHDERGARRRRRLTQAEERRLRRFEEVAAELQAQGCEWVELTVGLPQANIFARGGLRDIEFGFVARYLSPYCTCTTPLLAIGVLATLAAGGDMLVMLRVLAHRTDSSPLVAHDRVAGVGQRIKRRVKVLAFGDDVVSVVGRDGEDADPRISEDSGDF